jgi:outer membrane protein assembly factor BamB
MPNHCRPQVTGLIVASIALVPSMALAQSTTPLDSFAVTDGKVYALAEGGDRLYVGGAFTTVGPYTGGLSRIDPATGAPDLAWPKINGSVTALLPDGAGGFFVGGTFTRVGAVPRNNLAHLFADGTVSAWNPSPDGPVHALQSWGGTLYVGGDFTTIGGAARRSAAALDLATGAALAWDPALSGTTGSGTAVYAIAVTTNWVYLGGTFRMSHGVVRTALARVHPATGDLDAWDPNPTPYAVRTFLVSSDGSSIFVGGDFDRLKGNTIIRLHVAKFSTADGQDGTPLAWNPGTGSGNVYAFAFSPPDTLYMGGDFIAATGVTRDGLAAVSATTGALDATFNPDITGSPWTGLVQALALDGSGLHVGGSFSAIGGQTRRRIARVNPSTGAPDAWDPSANDQVGELVVAGGSVWAGGLFTSIGAQARTNLAALDAGTGELISGWDPGANATVLALAATADTVYAGGAFTNLGAQTRSYLAATDADGAVLSWNPAPSNYVRALYRTGSSVLVGGDFTSIGTPNEALKYVASLDPSSGANQWSFDASSIVYDFDVQGTWAYVGGAFSTIGGQARTRAARLDLATGTADPAWNPVVAHFSAPYVYSIRATPGSVFLGGAIYTVNGDIRNQFASVDLATGATTAWNADAYVSGKGYAIAIDGSTAFLGGDVWYLGAAARRYLGAVDSASGAVTPWDVVPDGIVRRLLPVGRRLVVGGEFARIGGRPQKGLAAFCLAPAPTALSVAGVGENFVSLAWTGSAPGYTVYRSRSADGPWESLGSLTGPAFTDSSAQGGVTYRYVVRSNDTCDSEPSNEVLATPTGSCSLFPVFEGVAWGQAAAAACRIDLGWAPATSSCGGTLGYSVYRDTAADFEPSAANRQAAGLTGTGYGDTAGLVAGATYYYVVRAAESLTGEEENLVRLAVTPFGDCTGSAYPAPVATFGVTSTSGQNLLEWVNPSTGSYATTVIRYAFVAGSSNCTFPATASDGLPLVTLSGTPGQRDSFPHTGLANDNTTYCYSAFVADGTVPVPRYSIPRTAKGRPFDTPAVIRWAYSTGASALAPPGIGSALFAVSNDRVLHGTSRGDAGGVWPAAPWMPLSLSGPAQERPSVIPGPPEIVLLGAQDGYAYAVSGATGAQLWRSAVRLGDIVQASPGALLSAYGGVYDYVLVGTRNSASDNVFYALNKDTGAVVASFDNGGGAGGIGIISGAATLDYANKRVIFASRARAGGSSDTLWCLQVGTANLTKKWSVPIGDVDGSPVLRNGVVYVGTNAGEVYAVHAEDGTPAWGAPLPVGSAVKGFLYPDRSGSDLFFSTVDEVWRISDDGSSGSIVWSHSLGAGITPSIPLFVAGTSYLYVGGSDGKLWQFDLTQTPPAGLKSVLLGDGTGVVGAPAYDNVNDLVYVGTDAGVYYAVASPLP